MTEETLSFIGIENSCFVFPFHLDCQWKSVLDLKNFVMFSLLLHRRTPLVPLESYASGCFLSKNQNGNQRLIKQSFTKTFHIVYIVIEI